MPITNETTTEQTAAENGLKIISLQARLPHISTNQAVLALRLADWSVRVAEKYLRTLSPAAIEGRLRMRADNAANKLPGFFDAPLASTIALHESAESTFADLKRLEQQKCRDEAIAAQARTTAAVRAAVTPTQYAAAMKMRATQELIAEMNLQASEYDREGNYALYAQLANVANLMQAHINRTIIAKG